MPTLIPLNQALELTQRSRSSFYLDMQIGLMPKPVKIGRRSARWIQEELEAIMNARIRGESDEEIRSLVRQMTE